MSTATLDRDNGADTGEGRLREFWNAPLATKVFWLLQVGVALEFIGHGMAGLWRSPSWIPYFTFFGFSKEFAHDHLYYVTGTIDVTIGALILFWPNRALLLHMSFWGLFTAVLRPVTGENFFELVERGANYGMPLALLLLSGWGTWSLRSWVGRIRPPASFTEGLAHTLDWVMRGSIALLLIGHGGLGIWANKPEWIKFFGWFGISPTTVDVMNLSQWVGVFEIALGLAVLIKPIRSLLLFVLVYKVGSELLRPLVGQNNFQFIERAGDYVLPMTLIWVLAWLRTRPAQYVNRPAWTAPAPTVSTTVPTTPAPVPAPALAPVLVASVGSYPWATIEAARVTANGNGHGTRGDVPTSPEPEVVRAAATLTARIAAQKSDPQRSGHAGRV